MKREEKKVGPMSACSKENFWEIDGRTGLFGLLGSPVEHSLSPAMHNEAFRLLGINARYLAFDLQKEDCQILNFDVRLSVLN